MSNLGNKLGQFDSTWRTLNLCWKDATQLWNDPVQHKFEQEFWIPMEGQVQATQRELERLAQIVAQAQRRVK